MENKADPIILPRTEDLGAWLVWLVPVMFLLLWDVWKAWKRRALWIPGQALVLSALIIQLLSFIDYSHISVYSGGTNQKEVEAILVKNQLVIDSGRLMMCVLIAYLLPGMARSGSITVGSDLTALAFSIILNIVSELRSVWKVKKRNESSSALAALSQVFRGIISNFGSTVLIVAFIYLLSLLIQAVIIGRTIRRIMSQRIPSAVSCCTTCDRPRYNDIKDHVLKCWIVVRVCQPDYFFSRTGLCSLVWPTVTVCLGVNVMKGRYDQFTDNELLNSVNKSTLVQFVIAGQFVIVLLGWIVLLVRAVTSVMQGNILSGYYFYGTSLEDAETHLSAYIIRLFVRDKRIQEKRIRCINKIIRDIHSLLWDIPWQCVEKLFKIIKQKLSNIKTVSEVHDGQFSKYEKTLEMFLIRGESARELWEANQWGFRKVERYMEQGQEEGKMIRIPEESAWRLWMANKWGLSKVEKHMHQGQEDGKCSPSELISFLKTGTPEDEAAREKAENLRPFNENSWKRTAVSLIHFMIYYYDGSDDSVIEDAMQCYIQAWEYMNFVDGLNEVVKSRGRQADGEFDRLQHSWNKRAQSDVLEREIKQPLRELIGQSKSCSDEESEGRNLRNSRDSTSSEQRNLQNATDLTEVAKNCLLETSTVIDPDLSPPQINKIHLLQRVLAKVYFVYMTEDVKKAVLQKCSKLAEEGIEEEILDVAFLAAKAQGVLDKVGEGNDREDPVEPRHNTDQASTSSTIPTEIELVVQGNDPNRN